MFDIQGDGIEFKRHFIKIRDKLKHIISKKPPAVWGFVSSQVPSQ